MRAGLLNELATVGYNIAVEGDRIKLSYRKANNPPDVAERLIDELRACKPEVLHILKSNVGRDGIKPSRPAATVMAIWKNPYPQGSRRARRQSLSHVMNAIWETIIDNMLNVCPQGIVLTDDILDVIDCLRQTKVDVLAGRAKLEDFRQAAESFEKVYRDGVPPRKN